VYNIFNSRGEFCPMPDAERDALNPTELDAYNALLDASAKCETAEALVIGLERRLVEQTSEIRSMESKMARLPKVDRITETRWALMGS
jgi:hypothetical protein